MTRCSTLRDVESAYFWLSVLPLLVSCMASLCMCACPCSSVAWHTVTSDQSPLAFPVLWLYWRILLHSPSRPGVYCIVLMYVKVSLSLCVWQFPDLAVGHLHSSLPYMCDVCLKMMGKVLTWSQILSQQSTICYKPIQMNECCHVVRIIRLAIYTLTLKCVWTFGGLHR